MIYDYDVMMSIYVMKTYFNYMTVGRFLYIVVYIPFNFNNNKVLQKYIKNILYILFIVYKQNIVLCSKIYLYVYININIY